MDETKIEDVQGAEQGAEVQTPVEEGEATPEAAEPVENDAE